jgi:hypothetical protein
MSIMDVFTRSNLFERSGTNRSSSSNPSHPVVEESTSDASDWVHERRGVKLVGKGEDDEGKYGTNGANDSKSEEVIPGT